MGVMFVEAESDVVSLVAEVLAETYPHLADAGVRIKTILASKGGDPLSVRGKMLAGDIKITSQQQRVGGLADALLLVSEFVWQGLSAKQQTALIDHHLCRLELVKDKVGLLKRDDCGRPKLRRRPYEFELAGFTEVVQRHGDDALEQQQLKMIAHAWVQGTLWG